MTVARYIDAGDKHAMTPRQPLRAASLARKYGGPVVPVRMKGRKFEIRFAKPVTSDQLDVDAGRATDQLKTSIERHLATQPDAPFDA